MTQVDRITLPNPVFDMEGENNAYLLVDESVALVDVGVATDRTCERLVRGLAAHDLSLSDVDHLFLTHWHPDHAGLAGAVQATSGATVHVHKADAAIVGGAREAFEELGGSRQTALREWGIPTDVREEILDRHDGSGPRGYGAGDPPTVTAFADGTRFSLGDATLRALHAPGHTAGETCFVLDSAVFTGDALLPDYTANVGGADPRTDGALSAHLKTLRTLATNQFEDGLPGHGEPMVDPAARARDVLAHHHDRAATLFAALGEPTTVWEAARVLFGDLGEIHLMLGLGETHAHLEHLRRAGAVERTDDGAYVAADADGLDEAFPEVRG